MFIYGGDSQDKGAGDIRFIEMLLKLKNKHPKRVILIIGNRDVNKLRLSTELNPICVEELLKASKDDLKEKLL